MRFHGYPRLTYSWSQNLPRVQLWKRIRAALRRVVCWLLVLPNVYFIGLCSYCGMTLYSHVNYMLVVRKGWGRERIALACVGCGSSCKKLKRRIRLRVIP